MKIYSSGFDTADELFLAENQMNYNAVCHLLLVIGEESAKIEESLKETQSFIAWDQIVGMRNRIAHDYRGIDREIVFQVVKNELPLLGNACLILIRQMKLTDLELQELLNNPFFRSIGYLFKK